MRHQLHLVAAGSVGIVMSLSAVAVAHEPVVVYGAAPYDIDLPPVGYVVDPADARGPIYVVNQGPVYSGPGVLAINTFAVPTYSEGGYAYGLPYPYIRGYGDWRYGYAPVYRPRHWRGRYSRLDDAYGYGPHVYRRHVFRPYAGAYRYRPAPGARVIKVNDTAPERTTPAAPPLPQARPQTQTTPAPAAPAKPSSPGQPDTRGHAR